MLFLLIVLSFAFIAYRSQISSRLTDMISGSLLSTIPTRNTFGYTRCFVEGVFSGCLSGGIYGCSSELEKLMEVLAELER